MRPGPPWHDLPEAFGDWNCVFRRFTTWSVKGVWTRIFNAMSDDPDFEHLIADSTLLSGRIGTPPARAGGFEDQARPILAELKCLRCWLLVR
jgi:Putative transposase of IS4/5 family (DUF4096)